MNECRLVGRVTGTGTRPGSFGLRGGEPAPFAAEVAAKGAPEVGSLVAVRAEAAADSSGVYFRACQVDVLSGPSVPCGQSRPANGD